MCHRHLSFQKSSTCSHLILTKEEPNVDCHDPQCFNSAAHPPDCAARNGGCCRCRRYYTQPIRVIIPGELPIKCPRCSSRHSRPS